MVFSDRRPGDTCVAEDPRTPIAPVARGDSCEDRRSTRRSAIAMLIGESSPYNICREVIEVSAIDPLHEGRRFLARILKSSSFALQSL